MLSKERQAGTDAGNSKNDEVYFVRPAIAKPNVSCRFLSNAKQKTMIKLGTIITDKVTEVKGMLTMYNVDINHNEHYLFQPSALNPETKEPIDTFWLTEKRIVGGETISVSLPLEILDTQVEDKATGFNGTAISLNYHLNGCVHVDVKPKGIIEKTGATIKVREFDVRRLKGLAIKELSDIELEKSKVENPSPEFHPQLFNS